jgi:uncharacterized protein (DUF2062 family)
MLCQSVEPTPPPPSSVPQTRSNPEPARTFWQRRIRDPIVAQLTQGITPEKIALTVAVGGCLALFPLIGTTTLLCFLAGIALRLNQPIIQLINQACWPIHIPAIYLWVRLGEKLYGAPHVRFSIRYMRELMWEQPREFWSKFGMTICYAITAWALLAPVLLAVVYYALVPAFREIKRLKTATSDQNRG